MLGPAFYLIWHDRCTIMWKCENCLSFRTCKLFCPYSIISCIWANFIFEPTALPFLRYGWFYKVYFSASFFSLTESKIYVIAYCGAHFEKFTQTSSCSMNRDMVPDLSKAWLLVALWELVLHLAALSIRKEQESGWVGQCGHSEVTRPRSRTLE